MRKVVLTMKENDMYECIKYIVEKSGNKKRAAVKLECSLRTINRNIIKYKKYGKKAFSHKNKGSKPVSTISVDIKNTILSLYDGKYQGANFTHFKELLLDLEEISISYSALYNLLTKGNNILSPKAERSTRRRISKKLKNKDKVKSEIILESVEIISNQIPLEDSHPRQERSKYFGEEIQMDASNHNWFGNIKTQLHLAIDDATSQLVGGYFDYQETLNGYYNVLNDIIYEYGIPSMIFTDNRTIFNYFKDGESSAERDTFTQFGYACKRLGIELKTSSIAQAKGRIERSFQTHQSRLITELRLAAITTIEEANEFLKGYIIRHNKKFALPINYNHSVFEKQEDLSELNHILAVLIPRKVDNGHSIKYNHEYYQPYHNGKLITLRPKSDCLVIKSFDGSMYISSADEIFNMIKVEVNQIHSLEHDEPIKAVKVKEVYVPPMSHPMKSKSFKIYQQNLVNKNKSSSYTKVY